MEIMKKIEQYDIFELRLKANSEPYAIFSLTDQIKKIRGFMINESEYAIRFMPESEGQWQFTVTYDGQETTGEFTCVANTGNNQGKVMTRGFGFEYEDGEKFIPVGTTCYAWTHQTPDLIAQTLDTLAQSPFNKIRMCLFPKDYSYNANDPEFYPFHKNEEGNWDVNKPDYRFWEHLENNIAKLCDLGIEADLILFHPYDRWGFQNLSREDNLVYLDYCIRRLAAYRNIWWSLANEYDFIITKDNEDWNAFGEKVYAEDPYHHLLSIHNGIRFYPKTKWMTHCSLQTKDCIRVKLWKNEYNMPIIIDECGYEGDIPLEWGNISAFELIHRGWNTVVSGGYVTHGETFYRDDEILWWSKGGKLHGQSSERFKFLKELQYEIGDLESPIKYLSVNPNGELDKLGQWITQITKGLEEETRINFLLGITPVTGHNQNYVLQYLGRQCPTYKDLKLPTDGKYRVEVVDVWEMTREVVLAEASGEMRIQLPGKEGIAILVTCLSGSSLEFI